MKNGLGAARRRHHALLSQGPTALRPAAPAATEGRRRPRSPVTVGLTATLARLPGPAPGHTPLGLAGATAVSAAAALGGHLAYRQAAGPDRAAAVPRLAPADWVSLGAVEDFPEGKPVRATAGELAVVVVREGDRCHVLAERCAHLSGRLSEGSLVEGCLRCPWHGSTFRLRDGEVVHGPATAPQPVMEARVLSGHLEIRLPAAG
ncbi:Rieske (2Fe-2S) protein [Kitasatospora xanthocidica]|uniref:Rieske (2Fe-2S) protein n=1 Tax=Kitasatospora xanthocidica TaxID=83382 RepID=A0A372ZLY9_9ACTN|nr:Rieske (2Fe-2S) protein [Kitasatospora xanthocidica]